MASERAAGVRCGVVGAALLLLACESAPSSTPPLVVADLSMSIAELEDLRQADPAQVGVGLVLGERYRRLGQLDEAETAFRRVLDGAGASPELQAGALGGLALVAQSRDDLALAEEHLLEALAVAEAAGLDAAAQEQQTRLAVLERVRGDFVAACGWYGRAGMSGAQTALTANLSCDAPEEVLALAASIWRAHASQTMEGLVVEARQTRSLADRAESAAARGVFDPKKLAAVLGDYSRLVLYTEGAQAAEAVARRAIALDPGRPRLQLHLISPLLLLDRNEEADRAADAVLDDRTSFEGSGRSPYQILHAEFAELSNAGFHRPHMNEILARFDARIRDTRPR